MLRYYDPIDGRITLGGVDFTQLHLRSVHERLGVVSQETQLFNATVEENIKYGGAMREGGREGGLKRRGRSRVEGAGEVGHLEEMRAAYAGESERARERWGGERKIERRH